MLGLVTVASAQTNESILFTAHLTGNTSGVGDGLFSLTGNVFSYRLITAAGFSMAAIHGPATSDNDAPLLFPLQLSFCVIPQEDTMGFCEFSGLPRGTGAFSLSNQQVSELLVGLWHVRAASPGAPSIPLRGQILQVPEPSVFSIVLVAGASVVGLKHALTRAGQRRTVQAVHRKAKVMAVVRECRVISAL